MRTVSILIAVLLVTIMAAPSQGENQAQRFSLDTRDECVYIAGSVTIQFSEASSCARIMTCDEVNGLLSTLGRSLGLSIWLSVKTIGLLAMSLARAFLFASAAAVKGVVFFFS